MNYALFGIIAAMVFSGSAGASDHLDHGADHGSAAPHAPRVVPNGVSHNGVSHNGVSHNGVSHNGVSHNGVSHNGVSHNGVSHNGVSHNGVSHNGLVLGGEILESVRLGDATLADGAASDLILDGSALRGTGDESLLGAVVQGELSDGALVPLRIEAVASLDGANADVNAYQISYATDEGWEPLCGEDERGPIAAVAVAGVFNYAEGVPGGGSYAADPSRFTFACRGKAIAKCVELGYKPWGAAPDGAPLTEHLVACTRMLRADYCGDGRSWTRDGTLVNLYDGIGVQDDAGPWAIEAEWTASGASCVNEARFTRLTVSAAPGTPSCFDSLRTAECGNGSHFSAGTILMSEMAQ